MADSLLDVLSRDLIPNTSKSNPNRKALQSDVDNKKKIGKKKTSLSDVLGKLQTNVNAGLQNIQNTTNAYTEKLNTAAQQAEAEAAQQAEAEKQAKAAQQAAKQSEEPQWLKDYYAYQEQQKADYEARLAQQQADYDAQVAQQQAEYEAKQKEEEEKRQAREQQAAANQTATSVQNVKDVQHQLERQLENYDLADQQNRALADVQLRQNSAKDSADRFEAQRDLQSAALGLFGSMGSNAMNSSTLGNLMNMLGQRNDKENNTFWAQHQVNQNAVENAYQDSYNQNVIARRDAMQNAEKAIRDIEGDWRASLNNINPDLFPGGSGSVGGLQELDSYASWMPERAQQQQWAHSSGYSPTSGGGQRLTPDNGGQRNVVGGDSYFSQLMNRFNGR